MFFDRVRASAPNRYGPVVSTNSEGIGRIFGAIGKTFSGKYVNEFISMNLPAVYSAVSLIADSMSQLPIDVYQKQKDGTSKNIPDHPVCKLLNYEPNPYMSAMTLRQTDQSHVLLWGNGYIEVERNNNGAALALWPLLPNATRAVKPNAQKDLYYETIIAGQSFKLAKEDVVHIPALGFDGYQGYSPITMAREAVGLGLAMQEFGAKFFGNDAKSGGFIMHPGKLSDGAQKNIKDSMDQQSGLDNAHRIKVLEEGAKFIATTLSPEDSQFLGSRQFQVAEIARIFRVPLVLLQSMEKSSSWGTGIEQLMIGFVVWTLQPWILRWEQELRKKLFTEEEKASGYYIKFNLNALLRGDSQARSAFYNQAVGRPWMSANEARRLEDMNPMDGLDEVALPLNMGGTGAQEVKPAAPNPVPPYQEEPQ